MFCGLGEEEHTKFRKKKKEKNTKKKRKKRRKKEKIKEKKEKLIAPKSGLVGIKGCLDIYNRVKLIGLFLKVISIISYRPVSRVTAIIRE